MANKHEVVFQWPHPEPNTVIVTGTFDNWAKEIHLTKGPTGFHGSTRIPWNEKIAYKFIVDGEWMLLEGEPTEADLDGNLNNIYTAPSLSDVIPLAAKPSDMSAGSTQELPQSEPTMNTTTPDNTPIQNPQSEAVVPLAESKKDMAEDVPEQKPEAAVVPVNGAADTLANGAPEQSEHAVTLKPESSINPVVEDTEPDISNGSATSVNADETAIPKPKSDDQHDSPKDSVSSPPETAPSPVAPDVPISIVPINAPENNTAPTDTLPSAANPSEGTLTPSVEPTQPSVTAVDDTVPPSEEPTPSTHSIIAQGSSAPVVGEIDSRSAEPSSPSKISHSDTTTTAHPDPEVIPLPPSTSGLNLETPMATEPQISTIPDSHVSKVTDDPSDHAVEVPQEIGTNPEDNEPPTPVAEDKSGAAPSHTTEEMSPKVPEPTEELSTAPPHVNETPEQGETPNATPSHSAVEEVVGLKPSTTDTTSEPSASTAPNGGAEHAPEELTPQAATPIEKGSEQAEKVSATAEPTNKGDEPSGEVASTLPEPVDTKIEPSTVVAPTEISTQPTPEPVTEKVNGSAPPAEAEKPTTNGHTIATATPPATEGAKSGAPASPTTPTKSTKHSFPLSGSLSASPTSSKLNTDGSRKKRSSFISKVKHLFSHDKDKEKEKK